MGFTTYANDKILDAFGQAAALGSPATHYIGLLTGSTWQASHAYSLGAYVIPTTFNSLSGQTGRIFKVTTAGTSGATEPTWPTTAGGTVTDGTVVFTEVTDLFQAGTFTGAEMAAGNYARVAVTANATNFPNASAAQPAVLQNGAAIDFLSPSVDWGYAIGWLDADAATAGNVWAWGLLGSAIDCAAGSNPSFAVDALQLEMTP